MYDVLYIDVLRRYKRVLKNRNQSLKDSQYDMLDVYDAQLMQNGLEIQKKRRNAIFQFNQIFGKLYQEITGIEGVTIAYEPSWKLVENQLPSVENVMQTLFQKRDVDKIMQTTMTGPHRDKIRFIRNGANFVPNASTGQRRLIALLLRVAQALFYTQITQKKPVLLMDDVLLELDPDKRQSVTAHLPEYDQLFCTFLPGEPYERYKHSTTRIYAIEKGTWHEQQ
jgi:DNA replication and repair protein RecF